MDFFYNKIVISCQGILVCRYVVSNLLDNFGTLINKLQSSITVYEKEYIEKI
jgi:hypothetical protein